MRTMLLAIRMMAPFRYSLSPSAFAEASADPPKSIGTKADEGGLGEGGVKRFRAAVDRARRRVRVNGSRRGPLPPQNTTPH